jgi:hypothetical protein
VAVEKQRATNIMELANLAAPPRPAIINILKIKNGNKKGSILFLQEFFC